MTHSHVCVCVTAFRTHRLWSCPLASVLFQGQIPAGHVSVLPAAMVGRCWQETTAGPKPVPSVPFLL